jgi:hypothetical protein
MWRDKIPAYWTPEQAFAVFELLDDLRDQIGAQATAVLSYQSVPSGIMALKRAGTGSPRAQHVF